MENTPTLSVTITEGLPSDTATLQRCLKDASVIFMCIASNESKQGTSISYDTATSVITALQSLRNSQEPTSYTKPTLLELRSASLNKVAAAKQPWLLSTFVHFCLQYCYADLQNACDLLSSTTADDADLLDYIIVDPGALHSPNGTTRTGHSLSLTEGSPGVMYADLGAAFCEIAERRAEFRGQAVLVSSVGEVTETWGVLAGYLGQGALGRVWG